MMGTSLLSVPWAIKQSGLIASIVIGFGMALVAMYTALLVIKIHAKYGKQLFFTFFIQAYVGLSNKYPNLI